MNQLRFEFDRPVIQITIQLCFEFDPYFKPVNDHDLAKKSILILNTTDEIIIRLFGLRFLA